MPINYPLTFPVDKGLARIILRAKSAVSLTSSPFTGQQDVQVWTGQWWELNASFPPLSNTDFDNIISFFLSLNGSEGTFLFGDPKKATPRGSASTAPGTPTVNGAGQTGQDLNCTGAPVNATNYLRAGDYIQLGSGSSSKLHRSLTDINSDASGNFTVTIWPKLRASPGNNDPITVSNTVGLWRLRNNQTEWNTVPLVPYNLSFEAVEAL